jgi:hypothetical protein
MSETSRPGGKNRVYNGLNGLGWFMSSVGRSAWLLLFLLPLSAAADNQKAAQPAHITKQTRLDIVHTFNAELAYVRVPFPMGKTGLKLKDGHITPSGPELQQMIAMWGPAAKPGDQARITDVIIKDNFIHFEINGGPVRRQKWYQKITIAGTGGSVPVAPSDPSANPRGSFVDLYFDKYVPEMTGPQLKQLLSPVFDFNSKTPEQAYLETIPPKAKAAIEKHQVLVGMNHEMVLHAKGRPPKKIREKTGETEHEDWIYGTPPEDVDFVRFIGDEVVRVETMKVDGAKIVRTEKEIDLSQQKPAVAKEEEPGGPRPSNAPSLRRPGEDLPQADPSVVTVRTKAGQIPTPPPTGTPDPNGGPGPN